MGRHGGGGARMDHKRGGGARRDVILWREVDWISYGGVGARIERHGRDGP
jgi:hypothetical protein